MTSDESSAGSPRTGLDRSAGGALGRFRYQPPVHSPVSASAFVRALTLSSGGSEDPLEAFAAELRSSYSADQVVLCGSGTQALRLAIEIATRDAGAESVVALPAFCCYDVASAAVGADRRVALYDLDPDTLAPDPASLEAVFRAGARAAVIAPLYGIPVPWEPLAALAARFGAVLIEDAAQGHGASWRGAPLGSLGEISVLSFGRGKGWTGGGGGALLLRGGSAGSPGPRLPRSGGAVRGVAGVAIQWLFARPALYRIPVSLPLGLGETHYRAPTGPVSITPFSATLLRGTRTAAVREAERRVERAAAYTRLLEGRPDVALMRTTADDQPGYLRFPLRLPAGLESFARPGRARQLGVASSYPTTLADLAPLAARLERFGLSWPGADRLVRELVTLPTHSMVSTRDEREIASLLDDADRAFRDLS